MPPNHPAENDGAAHPGHRALLAAALAGEGVLDLTQGPARLRAVDTAWHPGDDRERPALVVATSGSTSGRPDAIAIPASAIRASVAATHRALGGPGAWLLTLSADHIAGLMVHARALLGGTEVIQASPGSFDPAAFAHDTAAFARATVGRRRYVSLVPTQLGRLLATASGREAAAVFDAILVGGAATATSLLEEARAAGLRVVTTYGMTETCGGCLYDGVPVGDAQAELVDQTPDGAGRIVLRGPQVALGRVTSEGGLTPFDGAVVTSDRGRWETGPDGVRRLRVLGRMDDTLVSGGLNIDPHQVEDVLTRLDEVAEACVVGVPDDGWGQRVVAVVVPAIRPQGGAAPRRAPRPAPDALAAEVRRACSAALPRGWAPREVVLVDALPQRGPGKIDRRATASLAATSTPTQDGAASPDDAGASGGTN